MVRINEDDDSVCAVAIMWIDNNHQFSVCNAEPATDEETLYHGRWHQVEENIDHLEPELVETVLKIPVTIEVYYVTSGAINSRNKQRQDNYDIERNIITNNWWKRVNTSIFGIVLVYATNVHQLNAGPEYIEDGPNEWFTALAHELTDSAVEEQKRRSSNTDQPRKFETTTTLLTSNNNSKGRTANWRKQGR